MATTLSMNMKNNSILEKMYFKEILSNHLPIPELNLDPVWVKTAMVGAALIGAGIGVSCVVLGPGIVVNSFAQIAKFGVLLGKQPVMFALQKAINTFKGKVIEELQKGAEKPLDLLKAKILRQLEKLGVLLGIWVDKNAKQALLEDQVSEMKNGSSEINASLGSSQNKLIDDELDDQKSDPQISLINKVIQFVKKLFLSAIESTISSFKTDLLNGTKAEVKDCVSNYTKDAVQSYIGNIDEIQEKAQGFVLDSAKNILKDLLSIKAETSSIPILKDSSLEINNKKLLNSSTEDNLQTKVDDRSNIQTTREEKIQQAEKPPRLMRSKKLAVNAYDTNNLNAKANFRIGKQIDWIVDHRTAKM